MSQLAKFTRYGASWDSGYSALEVELECVKRGGRWKGKHGQDCGDGMFEHMMRARALIWPERYRHRWTDLMYENFIANSVTILMGSGSSQKTSHASEYALIRYWSDPENTLVILSTTTVSKLDMAIFGEIKMLWRNGKDRFDFLAGNCIESKRAIATDSLEEGMSRDLRRGIVGLACYVGKQFVGLGTFSGIKQKHVIFIADELQFMAPTFLDCLPNMMQGTEDLKVIGSGNPKHDPNDQLGKAARPKAGWESLGEIEKTTVWDLDFENGKCVNLVGTDSPNFDYPDTEKTHFPSLISPRTARAVSSKWGKNSLEYFKQCKGVMKIGMLGNRVITVELCRQHRAHENAVWLDNERKKIYALDPAWGGVNADRCVGGPIEFGRALDGLDIIKVYPPTVIPIIANKNVLPDDQIAQYVQKDCKMFGIEPEDVFYDSTGRGTIGAALARVFGIRVPVPIAFGDRPTSRPVRHDLKKLDSGVERHVRCDEYYSKFVTELWYSVRHVIECDQLREMPEDVMNEGTMREYYPVAGNKIEVEPKEDTMERMGCSPDLFDWLAIAVEGARQRGFKIGRLGEAVIQDEKQDEDFFDKEAREYEKAIKSGLLNHAQ